METVFSENLRCYWSILAWTQFYTSLFYVLKFFRRQIQPIQSFALQHITRYTWVDLIFVQAFIHIFGHDMSVSVPYSVTSTNDITTCEGAWTPRTPLRISARLCKHPWRSFENVRFRVCSMYVMVSVFYYFWLGIFCPLQDLCIFLSPLKGPHMAFLLLFEVDCHRPSTLSFHSTHYKWWMF